MKRVLVCIMASTLLIMMLSGCGVIRVRETVSETAHEILDGKDLKEIITGAASTLEEKVSSATNLALNYDDPDKYTIGDGEVPEDVSKIEVNWINGCVNFVYDDVDHVVLAEGSSKTLSKDQQLRYIISNGKLTVQFCKSGMKHYDGPEKILMVRIPRDQKMEDIVLDGVNVDVAIGSIKVEELTIHLVNGELKMEESYLEAEKVSIDAVNCEVDLKGYVKEEISVNVVNGDISVTVPSQGYHLEISTLSGNSSETVKVGDEEPELTISLDAVHGNIEVHNEAR